MTSYNEKVQNLIGCYADQKPTDQIVDGYHAKLAYTLGILAERNDRVKLTNIPSICPFDLTSDIDGILHEQWLTGYDFSEEFSYHCQTLKNSGFP